ncbi:hypothetical protein C8T65DRAFT_297445 [Cerioporus squamosus]|nr:hypothetical protein C8T65DRAFT_297445 [Cerioporus squamosus]
MMSKASRPPLRTRKLTKTLRPCDPGRLRHLSLSRLPAEILTQIFSHIHPTSPAHAGSVMLACRYWNAVLLRTSVFWADLVESPWTLNDISIRVYPERFATFRFAVAHSGTLPLDLGFVGMGEALSSFLTCHPSRMCSIALSVVLPKELMSLHTLLGGEMPNLGSLVIKQHRGPEYRTQIPRIQYPSLHEACLPHLHTLHLSGRHFALKAPLRSVRHLTLTRCSWTACGCDAFQFDSLIDVLGHFPDLEALTIDSSVPASGIATHRVRLKALRKLSIHNYSVSIADLLAQLDIPRDTMLDLRIPDDDNELYSQALPLQVRSTLLGVCAAETLHVRVRESLPAMRVRTRIGGALRLRLVSSSVNFVLEGLLSHLGAMFTPVTTLTTLVLDVWCDNLVHLSSLHDLLSMSALTTVGILGPDGRRALLPFMASTEGKSVSALPQAPIPHMGSNVG